MTDRNFDIVLYGATGFTGALVAEYLVDHALDGERPTRLALAARSRRKLEALREALTRRNEAAAELPLLVADAHDAAALADIAKDTKVVLTTVGPFELYGHELVRACVEAGTDYCDLTGEVAFMRAQIDAHHARAQETGARIVHACGFDSIPSDLGVCFLQDAMKERWGGRLHTVHSYFGESKGTFSGGTFASFLNTAEQLQEDRALRRIIANPYALYPEGEPPGVDGRWSFEIKLDTEIGMWTGPFVMAPVNMQVVRRSNALLDFAYGRDFSYEERMSFGSGPRGLIRATTVTGAVSAFFSGASIEPIRKLLQKKLPQPGEGPDREARDAGFFVTRFVAVGVDADGIHRGLRAKVVGEKDPGYGETAKMISEAALCLAHDELDAPGGVRTPASTMGMTLVRRLQAAGMTFEIVDDFRRR